MGRKGKKSVASPEVIMEELTAGWRTQALSAGIDLDVFSHIAAGKRAAQDVAHAAGASLRGMTSLLDALVGMRYLRKSGGRYGLQPVAAKFLVRGEKTYMGAAAQSRNLTWDTWKHLTEVVKTGRPYETVDVAELGKEFFPKLVAGIFPGNFAASSALVSKLSGKERRKIHRILDVAAGSAAWSLAFAKALPRAHVTTLDFPELTPIARGFAEKLGVADHYEFREGDMRQVDFGQNAYDLVILGHIIHSEGEQKGQELIRKSYAALRPGGLLLIAEFIPNDARTEPAFPLLFGLNMLLQTREGNVYTMREYRTWLKAAGFHKVRVVPAPAPSPLILATK